MNRTSNMPYNKSNGFTSAINGLPNIVIIMLGTNDSIPINWISQDVFEQETSWMITQFLNVTSKPIIYISLPPPKFCDNGILGNIPQNMNILNNNIIPGIKNVVSLFNQQGINIKIINVNGAFLDTSGNPNPIYANFFPDCLHPNKDGNLIIANTVYQALTNN
jgi:alpha-L-fucosidase 2